VICLITISELDVVMYDDYYSYFHTGLGFISGFVSKRNIYESIAINTIFLVYELWEFENIPAKRGDFIEFLIGFIIGFIIAYA